MGTAGSRHRRRLHALLRRPGRQAEARPGAQGRDEGRLGSDPRHRPGSRRRVDQLAPQAAAEAQGGGAPHRLPRDHRGGHPQRPRRRARGRRREPGAGPGEPPHPRPPLRLHALAGAVEEGADRALRRPGPERGGAADRRARRRAAGVPDGELLGPRRDAQERRRPRIRRHAGPRRRSPGRHRQGLRRPGPAHLDHGDPPRSASRGGARRRAQARHAVARVERRREAGHATAGGAVHHLDSAAGGQPQARILVRPHDERRPAAVPGHRHRRRRPRGPDLVSPHRLDHAQRQGARRSRSGRARDVRRRTTTRGRASTRPRSATPRKRTRRSARPTSAARRSRWSGCSRATS